MSRVVAVIQARMGSTRLPGKIMKPFAGEPLLKRIIQQASRSTIIDSVAVATTRDSRDDAVEALCDEMSVSCVRGSEDDVLGRMLQGADLLGADILVRLTGDNPMVDGTLIDFILAAYFDADPVPDYAANFGQDAGASGFPYGLYAEVATVEALKRSQLHATATDREHVTWFIRTHPDQFNMLQVNAPAPFPYDSLTVDTAEDYETVRKIYEDCYARNPNFGFRDLM